MWTCGQLKKAGWYSVNKNVGNAVLITLVLGLIQGGINLVFSRGNVSQSFTRTYTRGNTIYEVKEMTGWNLGESFFGTAITNILIIGGALVSLVVTFLVINQLLVGYRRWFLLNRSENFKAPSVGILFVTFKKNLYSKVLAATAWRTLWQILWGVLATIVWLPAFILFFLAAMVKLIDSISRKESAFKYTDFFNNLSPGIIAILASCFIIGSILALVIMLNRYYAYFFVDFILADNPDLGATATLNLSKAMSKGQKMHMFGLQLSFIGWYLLSIPTLGLLLLFVTPYSVATYTELYLVRKKLF